MDYRNKEIKVEDSPEGMDLVYMLPVLDIFF